MSCGRLARPGGRELMELKEPEDLVLFDEFGSAWGDIVLITCSVKQSKVLLVCALTVATVSWLSRERV